MSKKKAVTEQDLQAMGLFESSPGIFSKHQTIGFEIQKAKEVGEAFFNSADLTIPMKKNMLPDVDLGDEAIEPEVLEQGLIDFVQNEGTDSHYSIGYDPVAQSINPEAEFMTSPEGVLKLYQKMGIQVIRETPSRRTEPFPIPEIRLLTGKKRSIAVEELHEAAKGLVRDLGPTDIYIPTNVASSKNSKQLFKTGKKNAQVTRDAQGNTSTVIKETSFITDSQVSKAYRKQTDDSWKVNRLKFLAGLQGLKKPYRIEFTFIRTTLGKFDLHNMAQLPFDLMVDNGWLADDESTEVIPVFNPVVYYSRHFAGIVIRVIR